MGAHRAPAGAVRNRAQHFVLRTGATDSAVDADGFFGGQASKGT